MDEQPIDAITGILRRMAAESGEVVVSWTVRLTVMGGEKGARYMHGDELHWSLLPEEN